MKHIPICFLTDSYKLDHFEQYAPMDYAEAYCEARSSLDSKDQRIVYYGIRYIIETYLNKQWTIEDVENELRSFASLHNAGNTNYPFPKELFIKFIKENNGYFPITIKSLPEGMVVYPHTVLYTIQAEGEFASLITYLESLLMQVWYPTTVATLSRLVRSNIEKYFNLTVDKENSWKLYSRLHDFGYRGTTCTEQAVIGGIAHLLNFRGSDTVPAAYYGQYYLNNGIPIAESIPATEHSVMTSWLSEEGAVFNIIKKFGNTIYATVADSYDYDSFLNELLPVMKDFKEKTGNSFWVIRPDSGDPVECVIKGLIALDKVFGSTTNKKGFKIINGAGIIQGDGIDKNIIDNILQAVVSLNFSVENVAFGMGGGLLQKVNRDTLKFATKLCYTEFKGMKKEIFKHPKEDKNKWSMPGKLQVNMNGYVPQTFPIPATWEDKRFETNLLEIVYNKGPIDYKWKPIDEIREDIEQQMILRPEKSTGYSDQILRKMGI